jgi:putative transposase
VWQQPKDQYARHYNGHRPHQRLQKRPPLHPVRHVIDITAWFEHKRVVGGLISEYRRAV